jgi:hypothetical protein
MSKNRESCVIEEDIHNLLDQINDVRNAQDDQCEQLVQQHYITGDL